MNEKQLELIQVPFSAFLKIETPRFAERFIEIIEKHNPEKLSISKLYDLLVAEKPNIEKLTDRFGPHPLTKKIADLREMRSLRISAIKFHLKVVVKENKTDNSSDLQTVKSEINHFLDNLKLSKNDEMYSQKITQFLAAVAFNSKLKATLNMFRFDGLLNDLEEVHEAIDELIYRRLVSKSKRPTETTAQLTKSVVTAIKNMIKLIEIAPLLNEDINYKPLFSELNQFFSDYKNMINKRVLLNKNKTNKTDNQESSESTEITDIAQTKKLVEKIEDKNAKKENTRQLNTQLVAKGKTTTMHTDTIQLPIVGNIESDTSAQDMEKSHRNKWVLEHG
ncbi:MAG: hypothetical protein GX921_01065 [Bacteroidales bacterium]|nr:hypothetical protein [Bacteroidales bacterium]